MTISKTLDQDFFRTWSPEMAYVLGYFAADGCMIEHRNGGCYIEFTSTDKILLEHVKNVTASDHSISVRALRNKKWKVQYRLQIGSRTWYMDLALLGFTSNKSLTLRFPDVPGQLLGHFVRGYFDGDGCVYFTKLKYKNRSEERWMLLTLFTSGSLAFLESLHNQLKLHGLKGGSLCGKTKGAYELKFSWLDSLALWRLMYDTAQVSNLYLPRKREKLERAIQVLELDKELRS